MILITGAAGASGTAVQFGSSLETTSLYGRLVRHAAKARRKKTL